MHNLRLYLLGFLLFASAAVTTPLLSLNASRGAVTVAEPPIIGSPDPRFHVTVQFEGSRFPFISCLMNSVYFLYNIGSEDFSGQMRRVSLKRDEYPEVGMVVFPRTIDGTIERRFVIWGLSQGVAHMIRLNRFQAASFTLMCTYLFRMFLPDPDVDRCPDQESRLLIKRCVGKGRAVGMIKLVAWPDTESTQDVTQQPKLSFVNSSSDVQVFSEKRNNTSDNSQNRIFQAQIMMVDSYISPFDVFLLAITVLVEAAELQPRRRLQGYVSRAVSAGSGTPLRIVFEEPMPVRTSSPYFEVQWLRETMVVLPQFMVRKGAFQEAVILVELDGISVADGFLLGSPPVVGMTNVGSNVSVS